jgi:hypothetical protein
MVMKLRKCAGDCLELEGRLLVADLAQICGLPAAKNAANMWSGRVRVEGHKWDGRIGASDIRVGPRPLPQNSVSSCARPIDGGSHVSLTTKIASHFTRAR